MYSKQKAEPTVTLKTAYPQTLNFPLAPKIISSVNRHGPCWPAECSPVQSSRSVATQPQECDLLGEPGQCGKQCSARGSGEKRWRLCCVPLILWKFICCDTYQTPCLERPPSSHCEAFLAACSVENNEIGEALSIIPRLLQKNNRPL